MECFLRIIWRAKKWVQAIWWATSNFRIAGQFSSEWLLIHYTSTFPSFFNVKIIIQIEETGTGNINFRMIEKLLLSLIYSKGQTSLSSNCVSQPLRIICASSGGQNQHFKSEIQWKIPEYTAHIKDALYGCSFMKININTCVTGSYFFFPLKSGITVKSFENCSHRLSW